MIKNKPKEELTKAQKANEQNRKKQIQENSIMKDWKSTFTAKLIRKGKGACLAFLRRQSKNPMPTIQERKKIFGLGKDTSADFTRKAGYVWLS